MQKIPWQAVTWAIHFTEYITVQQRLTHRPTEYVKIHLATSNDDQQITQSIVTSESTPSICAVIALPTEVHAVSLVKAK